MNHSADYTDGRDAEYAVSTPLPVSHLVHTLRAYSAVILMSMVSVAVGYALVAILLYILSPAQRTTEQPFRLDFRGASEGTLPNGVRFSPTEIVSTPILLKVYQADQLGRFVSFGDFSRSVFVLESNREYEKLVSDYQSRLSDPRLSPLDRDRIQKEFELKSQSISKSDYAVAYGRTSMTAALPETLVRKVLIDILNNWADFATNEQHGLDYRVAVLTPQILDQSEVQSGDPIISIQVLRSKIYRVIENIEEINALPAAELMRTSDHMSLAEIRMRLEDIVRFRLEPLVGVARASGLSPNPSLTVHFLENQLAYDQRRLQAAQTTADAARDAMALYSSEQPTRTANVAVEAAAGTTSSQAPRPRSGGEAETVMPQLSDTFLERLVSLTRQASDAQYRQKLVDDYRKALNGMIPIAQAVSYQRQVLDQMKSGAVAGPRSDAQSVRAEIDVSTAEVRRLIVKVNEVYQLLSRNLKPSTELFSLASPPVTRIERVRTFSRLALYGAALLLVAFPIVVILCLLHNRVREEEAAARGISAPVEEPA